MNAVLGEITMTEEGAAMKFLVCAENAKQDDTQVRAIKGQLKNKAPQGGKGKGMDTPSAPIAGKNEEESAKSAEEIVHLDDITPKEKHGRELLDEWDVQRTKWVIHLSIVLNG